MSLRVRQIADFARNTSFLPGSKYDVFLSFRGEDTRTNFTDHLYTALVEKGIHAFRDDEELRRGNIVSENLLRAIDESAVFIIIFSENYANSKWCLNELVRIMECGAARGRKVFPIFYHVDPSDVRKQSGKYGDPFKEYENDTNIERGLIQKWRDALTEAGHLVGRHIENQYETPILKEITRETLCELIGNRCDEDGLVAKKSQLDRLKEFINKPKDVVMVGIYGLDGVGKTTIARALYDDIACQFEGASFLANVGEVSEKDGLYCLQKQLFCDILFGGENQEIRFHRMNNCLKHKLRDKKVLIVLDNVNDMKQLQTLAGRRDWYGRGSRIIITTQKIHLLYQHGVDEFHKPDELDTREALQLLSYHANTKEDSLYDFYPLSIQAISYCDLNPLALKVVGSFLRGKSFLQWQIQMGNLAIESAKADLNVLRVSYNGLNREEQHIFLDVACFFKGEYKDFVTKMLHRDDFSAKKGVKVLTDRCLITVSERKLWMQHRVQKLGWQIVREARKRCRFWDHKDIQRLLRTRKGIREVEGLSLDLSKSNHIDFPTEVFAKMTELKLLKVFLGCDCEDGKDNYKVNFSQDFRLPCFVLRYLHWHGYQLESYPPNFEAVELLELVMPYSRLRQIGNEINFPQLTTLDLSHSQHLANISNFSRMPNLERLVLEGCTSLVDVDPSVGDLNNLFEMNLKNCKRVNSLPKTICKLKCLRTLNVAGCSTLQNLPELKDLQNLENLNANGTSIRGISTPPPNLRILHLGHCKRLQGIPKLPSSIQQVDAYDCISMETLSWNTELAASILERIKAPKSEFSILIPGNRIPDCFADKFSESITTDQFSESSLKMELPNPDWYNDDFLGFAVCIVLAPRAELPRLNPEILCEMNSFPIFYYCGEDVDGEDEQDQEWGGNSTTTRDHVWLAYQPRARVERCRPDQWIHFTASILVSVCEVKEYAIGLVSKEVLSEGKE